MKLFISYFKFPPFEPRHFKRLSGSNLRISIVCFLACLFTLFYVYPMSESDFAKHRFPVERLEEVQDVEKLKDVIVFQYDQMKRTHELGKKIIFATTLFFVGLSGLLLLNYFFLKKASQVMPEVLDTKGNGA